MSRPTVDLAPGLAACWAQIGAGVLLALASLGADPGGRVLLLPAAALVAGLGLRDALVRPTLSLQDGGLVVVNGWRRVAVSWPRLERVRVVTDRRAPLLELDLGDTVVVLSRRRLGISPAEALELLEERRLGR